MSINIRIAAFAAVLVAVFGVAWAGGRAWGPSADTNEPSAAREAKHGGHEDASTADAAPQLVLERTVLTPGHEERIAFEMRRGGEALTRFDREAGVDMHLIVVRSDLTRYQHLHPTRDGSGWQTMLVLPDAGEYMAFVDFERDGERAVLQTRLSAAGNYSPDLEPADERRVSVGGYDVSLRGGSDELRFVVEQGGEAVELEDFIGAKGHLVAVHHDDLEYQHVHPLESSIGNEPVFAGAFERAGTYRLFLQFRHDGTVHTAAFDREVHG